MWLLSPSEYLRNKEKNYQILQYEIAILRFVVAVFVLIAKGRANRSAGA